MFPYNCIVAPASVSAALANWIIAPTRIAYGQILIHKGSPHEPTNAGYHLLYHCAIPSVAVLFHQQMAFGRAATSAGLVITVTPSPTSEPAVAFTATIQFHGRTLGERYCGDFWNWHYVHGDSDFVQVGGWPVQRFLPVMFR